MRDITGVKMIEKKTGVMGSVKEYKIGNFEEGQKESKIEVYANQKVVASGLFKVFFFQIFSLDQKFTPIFLLPFSLPPSLRVPTMPKKLPFPILKASFSTVSPSILLKFVNAPKRLL